MRTYNVVNAKTKEVFASYSTSRQASNHAINLCRIYGVMAYIVISHAIMQVDLVTA